MAGICGGGGGDDDGGGIDVDTSGPHNRAFVSEPISIAGKSIAELDQHCQNGAPPGKYIAWFSGIDSTAANRVGNSYGWLRTDGKPFANTITDLLAGKIYYPLRVDKTGTEVVPSVATDPVYVATNTQANGSWSGNACSAGTGAVDAGVADATTGQWTAYEYGTLQCNAMVTVRLYCLQVDNANDIPAPSDSGRLVFITRETVSGNIGIAAMDQLCTNEAGKPARAIVARPNASAMSRIPTDMQLVRPDGVVAFDANMNQLAPINVTTDRQYIDNQTWAGTFDINDEQPANETCEDWLDGSGTAQGRTGHSSRSREDAFGSVHLGGCNASYPVRCVVL